MHGLEADLMHESNFFGATEKAKKPGIVIFLARVHLHKSA